MASVEIVVFRAPAMIPSLLNDLQTGGAPVILVPQSFTLAAEKAVLLRTTGKGILGLKIFSPRSLIREINECAGKGTRKQISPDGRIMLISKFLLENEKKLKFYSKSVHQPGLPQRIAAQIDEFRAAGLIPSILTNYADNPSMSNKLSDIQLVWSLYDSWCGKEYVDDDTAWDDALSRLPASGIFEGAHLLIYAFDNITSNIEGLVRAALPFANKITIGLICDSQSHDSSIFLSTYRSITYFCSSFKNKPPVRQYICSSHADPGLQYVEKTLYALNSKKETGIPDLAAIKMYYGKSSYQECSYIAQTLIGWHQSGIAWAEMGVAICEQETLPRLLPQVLMTAGIPCTVRIPQSVMMTDLASFFVAVLHAMQSKWQMEDMMKIFRSSFLSLSENDVMNLENYVLEHGVNRQKWTVPFPGEDDGISQLEEIRSNVMTDLIELRKNLVEKKCSGKHAAELLYNYLIDHDVYNHLLEEEKQFIAKDQPELLDLNRQAWSSILDILDQLATFIGSYHISLDDLCSMVSSSLEGHQIKSLPQSADTVILSQPSMFLSDGIRAMVVAGFQQASTPLSNALLSDRERRTLANKEIIVGFTRDEMASRIKQDVYQVVSLATEQLLISCSASKPDGGILYPSQQFKNLAEKLRKQYPDHVQGGMQHDDIQPFSPQFSLETLSIKLREMKEFGVEYSMDSEWQQALSYLYHDKKWNIMTSVLIDSLHAKIDDQGIKPEQADILYPTSFSPSFAETAGTCPCQNWIQRGLLLQPRREFAFEMDQQGSFAHEVLNRYFREAMKDPDWPDISKEKIRRILAPIFHEETCQWRNGPLGADLVHRFQGVSIIRNVRTICEILTGSMQNQPHFLPYAMEAGYGMFGDHKFPAVEITTPAGRRITLSGIIDRVDTLELPDGRKFFLVTDYKSSEKEMRWSSMTAGLQLQLPVYLQAAAGGLKGYEPAGAVFQPVKEIVVETSKDKVEDEMRKVARIRGLVLDDKVVQAGMEPLKVSKKSATADIIPVVSSEELSEIVSSSLTVMGELIDMQFSGVTSPSPLADGDRLPCEYCPIQKACPRDPRLPGGKARYLIHKRPGT